MASAMARAGMHFVEIAGNSSIIVSVLAPRAGQGDGSLGQRLFSMPVVIRPEWQRLVLRCDVPALDQFLVRARSAGLVVEHIYDY